MIKKMVNLSRMEVADMNHSIMEYSYIRSPARVRFGYALSHNYRVTKDIVDCISMMESMNDGLIQYEAERKQLAEKYAKRDNFGKIVNGEKGPKIANVASYLSELSALQEKNQVYAEHKAFLNESIEIELMMVDERDLPEFMDPVFVHAFLPFIVLEGGDSAGE